MSQQSLFTTVTLNTASAANIYVKTGFIPGRIELINLTQVQTPADTKGWKAIWQQGMSSATAIITTYKLATNLNDVTTYTSSGGITLLNAPGSEVGQYGATVSGFTNANPGVLTVDSTANAAITAGCVIRVAGVANTFAGATLNGDYYVASVTATTITLGTAPSGTWSQTTLTGKNTSALGVYVSGGFVTVLQTAAATTPNPPYNIYSNVPLWYNEGIQGFIIGTSCFAGATYSATTGDTILVSAWDQMQP